MRMTGPDRGHCGARFSTQFTPQVFRNGSRSGRTGRRGGIRLGCSLLPLEERGREGVGERCGGPSYPRSHLAARPTEVTS